MAAKYILKKLKDPDNQFDVSDVVVRIETETLEDILQGMSEFIRACGFYVDGELDFVEDEKISMAGSNNEEK